MLLRILPSFVHYFTENPQTLINRFFGLHSITMYNFTIYFVVIENVFVPGAEPHEIYDIKGSWIDRHTNHHVDSGKIMKDEDLHKTIKLIPEKSAVIYKQLKEDSKFLMYCRIMDYSILLGIFYVGIDPNDMLYNRRRTQKQYKHNYEYGGVYHPPNVDSYDSDIRELRVQQQHQPHISCIPETEASTFSSNGMQLHSSLCTDNQMNKRNSNSSSVHGSTITAINITGVSDGAQSLLNNVLPSLNQSNSYSVTQTAIETSFVEFPPDLETLRANNTQQEDKKFTRKKVPSYASGIRKCNRSTKAMKARIIEGPGIYYLGIIDVLQEWNTQKQLEHYFKVFFRCKSKNGISCVEPVFYRKRFLRKIYRIGIRPIQ